MDFRCRDSSRFALHHSRMTDFNDTCLRTLCDNWKTWWCLIDCKEKYSNIKHYLDDCGFYLFVYLQHSNTKQSSQFDQHCNLFNKISLLWLRMNNKRWQMKRKHLCTHQCNCINCLNIKWAYRFLFICRVLGVLYTRISQPVLSIFFIWFCFVLFVRILSPYFIHYSNIYSWNVHHRTTFNGTGVFCCHLISFLHYHCHYFYGGRTFCSSLWAVLFSYPLAISIFYLPPSISRPASMPPFHIYLFSILYFHTRPMLVFRLCSHISIWYHHIDRILNIPSSITYTLISYLICSFSIPNRTHFATYTYIRRNGKQFMIQIK